MKTHNPDNERIKRRYFTYLKEAMRYSEATLDGVAKALYRFESYARFRSFKSFHIEQAVAFKRHLAEQRSERTGKPLAKATRYSTLMALKRFFHWLAGQPGFRSRLSYSDAEYFNPSGQETQIAKAHREQAVPTLEQIEHVLGTMLAETEIERRNRALIAFTILTGARDGAIASFKLKHVDIARRKLVQDARDVHTKFSKTFTSWFFPVGDGIREIVDDWVTFLLKEKLWGPDDPLFPATRVELDADRQFRSVGLDRKHWSNAAPIRKIFRQAFEDAGLPYYRPHSFRGALAQLAQKKCQGFEQMKAWSQNLGHEKLITTLNPYGTIGTGRQAEIMRELEEPTEVDAELEDLAREIVRRAKRKI